MSPKYIGRAISLVALVQLGGCDVRDDVVERVDQEAARIAGAVADSAEQALAPVPLLSAADRRALRRHLNDSHHAAARARGIADIEDSATVSRLVAVGRLVRLQDTTAYWTVRELDHSMPFVTPDAHAMLVEIGGRFHRRLDSLGVPRYRFEVSSGLRTAALQADLRRGNPNASRGTSSHEYGTTVDIPYNAFTAPAAESMTHERPAVLDTHPDLAPRLERRVRRALEEVAHERRDELKGILGRVLVELQQEGILRGLHERAQPVYHITVAAPFPSGE